MFNHQHLSQLAALLTVVAFFSVFLVDCSAQESNAPAPASIGADVPLTYFGPSPSQVQKELVGPYQLLKSGVVDQEAGTVTLPLYRGTSLISIM